MIPFIIKYNLNSLNTLHNLFTYKGSTSEEESSSDSSHEKYYKEEQHSFKDNQCVLPASDENPLHQEKLQQETNLFDEEEEISVDELNHKDGTLVSNELASDNQSLYFFLASSSDVNFDE